MLNRLLAARPLSRRQFLGGLAALGVIPRTAPVPEPPVVSDTYVVLIVIDACRPSYLSLTSLPHLHALIDRGVIYEQAWGGEMESETPTVHATLGTGTLPRQNGFVGFGWVQPGTRQKVDFRTLLAEGQIDPVLRTLPTPSVAARVQQLIPGGVVIAASGHKNYAVVGLAGGAATYGLYGAFQDKHFVPASLHSTPPLSTAERRALTIKSPIPFGGEDAWAFRYALTVARKVPPRLLMINLPEVDTWGHWYGPNDHALFSKLLLNIDRGIGEIQAVYQKLGLLERTAFIITSDHGMFESLPVPGWTTLARGAAEAAGTSASRADGTTGAIWLRDPSRAKAVARHLVAARPVYANAIFYRSAPGDRYTYLQASPTSWLVAPAVATALQHLLDTTAGKNGPDVWVIFRENYTAAWRNVSGQWKGTHGGAAWQAQHIPLILSGPGIRQGVQSSFPARSIDVTPTMEALLGLPPIPRSGVTLADALARPPSGQLAAQAQVQAGIQADVAALRQQAAADTRRLAWERGWPVPPPHIGVPVHGTVAGMPTCDCD